MEAKIIIVLLINGLLSSALADQELADRQDSEDQCHLKLRPSLPGIKCTLSHCSQIRCSARFRNQEIELIVNIDQWQENVTAYVTLSVPKLDFYWSHSFEDGDKLKIDAFPLKIQGSLNVDVFLQMSLRKNNDTATVDFKVDLLAGLTEVTQTTYNVTIVEGQVPIVPEPSPEIVVCYRYPGNGFVRGFNRLPKVAKVMICTGALVFFILLMVIIAFFCKKKRATYSGQLKVKPPSYDEATSTKTKVPMQLLINEV